MNDDKLHNLNNN